MLTLFVFPTFSQLGVLLIVYSFTTVCLLFLAGLVAQRHSKWPQSLSRPPLTSLERQAKTEYNAREYFSDEKKAPGAYPKLALFQWTRKINKSLESWVSAADLAGCELGPGRVIASLFRCHSWGQTAPLSWQRCRAKKKGPYRRSALSDPVPFREVSIG